MHKKLTDLNTNVLLEVFANLNLIDSINLAETCIRLRGVAEIKYRKYANFNLCEYLRLQNNLKSRVEYSSNVMDARKVLSHIGPYISTLTAQLKQYQSGNNLSKAIQTYCLNVKSLTIWTFDQEYSNWMQKLDLESLTLKHRQPLKNQLGCGITTLKKLKITFGAVYSAEEFMELYKILKQNPNIESLCMPLLTSQFNHQIFENLNNLRYLGIRIENSENLGKLTSYLKMNELAELYLEILNDNKYTAELNTFLTTLAENSKLVKLSMLTYYTAFGESTLRLLSLFKLQSLRLIIFFDENQQYYHEIPLFQPNLTNLDLFYVDISLDILMILIKGLSKLETFHFEISSEAKDKLFNERINEILDTSTTRPTLQLHFNCCIDNSPRYFVIKFFFNVRQHNVRVIPYDPNNHQNLKYYSKSLWPPCCS